MRPFSFNPRARPPRRVSALLRRSPGRFQPLIERLEDRLAPAAAFDPRSGLLAIVNEVGPVTVRQEAPAGFLDIVAAGLHQSSDPASPFFDPALAGATGARVTALR